MSEPKVPQQQPKEPAQAPEQAQPSAISRSPEVQAFRDLMEKHGSQIATWVLAGLVGVAIGIGYKTYKKNRIESTSEALWTARTPQDLETLIEQQPSSAAAPLALLKVAKRYYDAQKYDLAVKKYTELQTQFPTHPLVDVAEMGKLHCAEARGQIQEALQGFTAFARQHPNHYLTSQALLAEARCLEELGRLPEAKTRYEDFIAGHSASRWSLKAEELLNVLTRRIEKQGVAATASFPSPTNEPSALATNQVPLQPPTNLQIKLDLPIAPARTPPAKP